MPSAVSIEPKSFVTTWIVAPFFAAQAFATLETEAARFASVQMTIVGPALWKAIGGSCSYGADRRDHAKQRPHAFERAVHQNVALLVLGMEL